ncbi:MAG: helix-turn-helix domain-containing protein [Planctomycetota bacterium]
MARQSPFVRVLSASERRELLPLVRSTTAPAARVRRAQVILRFADGVPVAQIARALEMQRHDARKWIKRFIKLRAEGLEDLPRSGRPPVFPPAGRARDRQDRVRAT